MTNYILCLEADLIHDSLYLLHLVKLLASLLSLDHPSRTNTLEQNVHEYPIGFVASVARIRDTLLYFVETVRKAGLRMIEVSESKRPATCLTDMNGLNISTILLHRLQAWRD